jgi:hypothetical protein
MTGREKDEMKYNELRKKVTTTLAIKDKHIHKNESKPEQIVLLTK